ncbi:XRE family transcriptional regulator [Lachnospiraceae bacterium OF09-6]|nr:XRE family transcriptional regulator [Lachnospiraceae bacterium OF09-6]
MQKIRPDLDIGRNIQQLRYNAQLTQEQVLAKLNVMGIQMSKSTYAKIETNRMNIKVSELIAFAKIFDTDFNAFFKGLWHILWDFSQRFFITEILQILNQPV